MNFINDKFSFTCVNVLNTIDYKYNKYLHNVYAQPRCFYWQSQNLHAGYSLNMQLILKFCSNLRTRYLVNINKFIYLYNINILNILVSMKVKLLPVNYSPYRIWSDWSGPRRAGRDRRRRRGTRAPSSPSPRPRTGTAGTGAPTPRQTGTTDQGFPKSWCCLLCDHCRTWSIGVKSIYFLLQGVYVCFYYVDPLTFFFEKNVFFLTFYDNVKKQVIVNTKYLNQIN